jgi:hypothetical protein
MVKMPSFFHRIRIRKKKEKYQCGSGGKEN